MLQSRHVLVDIHDIMITELPPTGLRHSFSNLIGFGLYKYCVLFGPLSNY